MSNEQSEVRVGDVWEMLPGYFREGQRFSVLEVGKRTVSLRFESGFEWGLGPNVRKVARLISRAPSEGPPKHPERKPGQRVRRKGGVTWTLLDRRPSDATFSGEWNVRNDSGDPGIISDRDLDRAFELVADAHARVAPLSAQGNSDMGIPHPKGCMCEQCKPAPPAPTAKAANKLSCIKHHDRPGTPYAYDTRTFLFCGECQDAATAWLRAQDGTPCAQPPGLLPKPRMAHVANQDWDVGVDL